MSVKTVPVVLPERVWGRLASIADTRGVTVADMLGDAVEALVSNPGRQIRSYQPVVSMVEGGRLAVLDAELSAARRAGYRAPIGNRKGREGR